jgi:hypothetical protein
MAATTGWIRGKNLRMAVGGKVILGATKCSYQIDSSFSDVLNKDTANWDELLADKMSWTMNVDAHLTMTTDANKTTHTVLLTNHLAQTIVVATFSIMTTASTPIPNAGDQLLTGNVACTSLGVDSDVSGLAMGKYSFKGSGALVQTTAA